MFTKSETPDHHFPLKGNDYRPPLDKDGKEYWTGKQIFSSILPKDLRMVFKSSICGKCTACQKDKCEHDAYVG